MRITAKTKKTQCQRLLAYLKRNRKGITTMEAFQHLGITCAHKRIGELEEVHAPMISITRHREKTDSGATVTRYKLAR